MKKFTCSLATLWLIAFSLMAPAGLPGPKAWAAEADRAELVRAVADLSELRDRIADRWALLMKGGWNAYADDQLVFAEFDQSVAKIKPWLEATPPDDPLKAEKLTAAVAQVLPAEIAYVDSLHNMRNRVAQCFLNNLQMIQVHGMVRDATDALVLGRRPQALLVPPPASVSAEQRPAFSFKFQARPEGAVQPAPGLEERRNALKRAVPPFPSGPGLETPFEPLPAVEPSSDPATLRAAYEALKASQAIYSQLLNIPYEVQLAMVDFLGPPKLPVDVPQYFESLMEPLRRLPGLTERESKPIENIPEIWARMAGDVKAAEEALTRKQAAQADLEQRVQAALAAIDDLRAYYLNRLAE